MKGDIKKLLREAYEAPAPQRKAGFIKKIRRRPEIGVFSLVMVQAAYIRKRIWILDAGLFLLAVFATGFMEADMCWVLSALTPFLALSAITENTRSVDYGMAELEMASCFSLKSVVLARMAILGTGHFILLLILTLLTGMGSDMPLLQAGVYLLLPYMLTTVCSLGISRKIHGREGTYVCLAAAVLVSVIWDLAWYAGQILHGQQNLKWCLAAAAVLAVLVVREYIKLIHQTEEMTWKFV